MRASEGPGPSMLASAGGSIGGEAVSVPPSVAGSVGSASNDEHALAAPQITVETTTRARIARLDTV